MHCSTATGEAFFNRPKTHVSPPGTAQCQMVKCQVKFKNGQGHGTAFLYCLVVYSTYKLQVESGFPTSMIQPRNVIGHGGGMGEGEGGSSPLFANGCATLDFRTPPFDKVWTVAAERTHQTWVMGPSSRFGPFPCDNSNGRRGGIPGTWNRPSREASLLVIGWLLGVGGSGCSLVLPPHPVRPPVGSICGLGE